jgi:hypothetical protein
MENTDTTPLSPKDPLGARALAAAVAALRAASQGGSPEGREALPDLVSRLEAAHGELSLKMELLRDRYELLKRSSAHLAEEVVWLRDQLDDLRSTERPQPQTAVPPPQGADHRRYADRWHGGNRRG